LSGLFLKLAAKLSYIIAVFRKVRFAMADSIARRLEQYTVKRSHEVLIVKAEIDGEFDEIAIFKGFSSSLTRSTAFDPDVPVLPEEAKIVSVDRLESPYNPNNPRYLQQGLSWETMQSLLSEAGV
jgi:hypothetical protein